MLRTKMTLGVVVAALALRFDAGERPTAARLTGMLIGLAGVAALVGIEIVALERLEIEADGRNRRLRLVGDRVDEGIVLFVPAHFPHQEDGVQHDAGNDDEEEDDAEDEKEAFAPVEQDPADVERHGSRDQARAEDDRGRDPLTAADRHKGEDKSIRNAEFGVRNAGWMWGRGHRDRRRCAPPAGLRHAEFGLPN